MMLTADYMGRVTLFALVTEIVKITEINRYFFAGFKNVRKGQTGIFANAFMKRIQDLPYVFLVTTRGEIGVYAYNIN